MERGLDVVYDVREMLRQLPQPLGRWLDRQPGPLPAVHIEARKVLYDLPPEYNGWFRQPKPKRSGF